MDSRRGRDTRFRWTPTRPPSWSHPTVAAPCSLAGRSLSSMRPVSGPRVPRRPASAYVRTLVPQGPVGAAQPRRRQPRRHRPGCRDGPRARARQAFLQGRMHPERPRLDRESDALPPLLWGQGVLRPGRGSLRVTQLVWGPAPRDFVFRAKCLLELDLDWHVAGDDGCGVPRISIFGVFRRGGRPLGAYLASAVGVTERFSPHADNGVEVGRQFAVECCRDDVTNPGADVDAPLIAKSHDMTRSTNEPRWASQGQGERPPGVGDHVGSVAVDALGGAASFARRGSVGDPRRTRSPERQCRSRPPASFLAVVACALASLNSSSPLPRTARQRPGAHSARDSPAAPLGTGGCYRSTPLCPPGPFSGGRVSADDGLPRDRPPSRPSAAAGARTGPTSRRPPRPGSGPRAPAPSRRPPADGPSPRPPSPGTTSGSRAARRRCRAP